MQIRVEPVHPKVMRAKKLNEWFNSKLTPPNPHTAVIPLSEFFKKLEDEGVDLSQVKLHVRQNIMDTLALPSNTHPIIEVTTMDKSLLNANWEIETIIQEICEFPEYGWPLWSIVFQTAAGRFQFQCEGKNGDDLKAWIAGLPDGQIYQIREIFEDHPETLCHSYTLSEYGLYYVSIESKTGIYY